MAFAAGDSESLAITSYRKCTSLKANKSDLYYLCMNTQIEYYYIFRFSAACKSSKLLKHILQKCRLKCNGQCVGKKKTCGLNPERKTLLLCFQFYSYPRVIKDQYEMRNQSVSYSIYNAHYELKIGLLMWWVRRLVSPE